MHFRSHRGGVYYTPENTMPAFRDALAKGFDAIETDPTLTKDGVIVLSHDAAVNRCLRHADGSVIEEQQRIVDLTYEQLMERGLFWAKYSFCFPPLYFLG